MGTFKYGSDELEVESHHVYLQEKKKVYNSICIQTTRKVEGTYKEMSCVINHGFVVRWDHSVLGNVVVEVF